MGASKGDNLMALAVASKVEQERQERQKLYSYCTSLPTKLIDVA